MKADYSKYEDSGRGLLQFLEDSGLKIDHTTGIDGSFREVKYDLVYK